MNNTDKTISRRPRPRSPVKVIVTHEFVGEKTLSEAFIPVIVEYLRRKAEQPCTFDNECDTA